MRNSAKHRMIIFNQIELMLHVRTPRCDWQRPTAVHMRQKWQKLNWPFINHMVFAFARHFPPFSSVRFSFITFPFPFQVNQLMSVASSEMYMYVSYVDWLCVNTEHKVKCYLHGGGPCGGFPRYMRLEPLGSVYLPVRRSILKLWNAPLIS